MGALAPKGDGGVTALLPSSAPLLSTDEGFLKKRGRYIMDQIHVELNEELKQRMKAAGMLGFQVDANFTSQQCAVGTQAYQNPFGRSLR